MTLPHGHLGDLYFRCLLKTRGQSEAYHDHVKVELEDPDAGVYVCCLWKSVRLAKKLKGSRVGVSQCA